MMLCAVKQFYSSYNSFVFTIFWRFFSFGNPRHFQSESDILGESDRFPAGLLGYIAQMLALGFGC